MTEPTQAQLDAAAKAYKEIHNVGREPYYHAQHRLALRAALTAAAEVEKENWPSDELINNLVASATEEDSHTVQSAVADVGPKINIYNSVYQEALKRCAQVARKIAKVPYYHSETAEKIASDIEALKDQPSKI